MKHAVHFSSMSDNWQTPPELFAVLQAEFNFTLDAASSHANALCARHFTAEDDALTQDWRAAGKGGNVWVNPPYSRGLQAKFIQQARDESAKLHGPVVVCLIPARPDTLIWQRVIFPYASEIRFLKGRVRFVGATAGAPFPSAVVIFGQNIPQKVRGWNWKNNSFAT